jgi:hypothetical protein
MSVGQISLTTEAQSALRIHWVDTEADGTDDSVQGASPWILCVLGVSVVKKIQ